MTLKELKEVFTKCSFRADTISLRGGEFTIRNGFFYTHGMSSEKLVERLKQVVPTATISDHGQIDKPFKGGGTTAQNSHFYVKFKV